MEIYNISLTARELFALRESIKSKSGKRRKAFGVVGLTSKTIGEQVKKIPSGEFEKLKEEWVVAGGTGAIPIKDVPKACMYCKKPLKEQNKKFFNENKKQKKETSYQNKPKIRTRILSTAETGGVWRA